MYNGVHRKALSIRGGGEMLRESVKEGMYEQEPKASIQVNVCVHVQEWAWGDVPRSRRLHMLEVDPEIGRNPGCLGPHLRGWTW